MSQFTTLLDYRSDAAYRREIADLRAQLDAERKRADANRDGANAEYERLQAVADAAREERDGLVRQLDAMRAERDEARRSVDAWLVEREVVSKWRQEAMEAAGPIGGAGDSIADVVRAVVAERDALTAKLAAVHAWAAEDDAIECPRDDGYAEARRWVRDVGLQAKPLPRPDHVTREETGD